jgi:hypothetical protein
VLSRSLAVNAGAPLGSVASQTRGCEYSHVGVNYTPCRDRPFGLVFKAISAVRGDSGSYYWAAPRHLVCLETDGHETTDSCLQSPSLESTAAPNARSRERAGDANSAAKQHRSITQDTPSWVHNAMPLSGRGGTRATLGHK